MALAQRNIEIAKQRGFSLTEILSYHLLPQSPLFQGDFPTEPNKSVLVSVIEEMISSLNNTTWIKDSNYKTHVLVDFMPYVRQARLNNNLTLD